MKKIQNSKLVLKILSAIIAVILWSAITYTEDPVITQTVTGIDISFLGEDALNDNGFAIIDRSELPTVSVVIRGKRNSVIDALDKIYATANVSSIKSSGENEVLISYSYPKDKVTIEKIKTKEIPVKTEALIEREIPVKIEAKNRDKSGSHIIKSDSETKHITVSGAANTVYKISYARVQIDIGKVSKTSTQNCMYELCNESGEVISEENIVKKSNATVAVKNTVYEKTSLPINVVLDDDYKDTYDFEVNSLAKDKVDAGIDDGVKVDRIDAVVTPKKNETTFEAKLVIPDGVYVLEEDRTVSVTGELVKKATKEVSVSVDPINIPDGNTVELSPQKETIKLKTTKNVNDIEVTATVNVADMKSDEELLPVKVKVVGDAEVVGSYNVKVKMRSGE